MAKILMEGLDEYTQSLARLQAGVKEEICGPAIYKAAAIVTDEIRAQIKELPTEGGIAPDGKKLRGPNKLQKEGLLESLGISPMDRDSEGVYNVRIGFDGYNAIITKLWPNGQPNLMVARAVDRGTSFMRANRFIKRALDSAGPRALEAMRKSVEKGIKTIMD